MLFHHEGPVRLSQPKLGVSPAKTQRAQSSEIEVKIIYKSFCPFPITWRLCALAEEFPTPSTFDARLFAQAAQIFNYSNTKSRRLI